MIITPSIQTTLVRYQTEIQQALRQAIQRHSINVLPTQKADLTPFYGQMQYHLGWVDSSLAPINGNTGKLLRPTLLLLAYEAAGAWGLTKQADNGFNYLRRALPAAAAIELIHNFTLIHDDIVDHDTERHHQPTLWAIWGSSQGINTGDGMFSLARLALWDVLDEGVESAIAVRLGATLDRTALVMAEGQYLDLSFEQRQNISVSMYVDMIARKTAALMSCAAEIGARLGTRETATIESLRDFGFEIGLAFQVRDDMLGIWASATETGKTSAGDIYRRKKSLPILHALERANEQDQHKLHQILTQENPISNEQVAEVLAIFERTHTRQYCLDFLIQQCAQAHHALNSVPRLDNTTTAQALHHMEMLVHFLEATVRT
jgi:geranylgeranyl diphosphate synthase, type I